MISFILLLAWYQTQKKWREGGEKKMEKVKSPGDIHRGRRIFEALLKPKGERGQACVFL